MWEGVQNEESIKLFQMHELKKNYVWKANLIALCTGN